MVFCAVSKTYYRVVGSPLNEHTDIDVHLIVRNSLLLVRGDATNSAKATSKADHK